MRNILVVLGLFILAGVALAQPVTPHTVFGYFERSDGNIVPEDCLHLQIDFNGNHFDETSPEFTYFEDSGLFFLRITDALFDPGDLITFNVGDSCLFEAQTYADLMEFGPETEIETIVLNPIAGLRPILIAGFMNPTTGYVTNNFDFGATYVSNPWNRPAEVVQVWIDGALVWDMARVSGGAPTWATGEAFLINIDGHDIGKGDHAYRFYAEDDRGLPVWTDPVDFNIMNTAPQPPEIALDPVNPFDDENILVTVTAPSFDEDGDEIVYYYEWLKDGVLMAELSGFMADHLDAANTSIGENWSVRVYGFDGSEYSLWVSDDVTIIAPTLTDGGVDPTTGDRGTVFTYTVTYTNIRDIAPTEVVVTIDDGDPIPMAMARVWDEGVVYTYETTLDLGDHVYRFSGIDELGHECIGDIDEKAGPFVGNHAPTIEGAIIVVDIVPATVLSTLTAEAFGWVDLDGDPEGYLYSWFVNDVEIGVETASIAAPDFARGDEVYCVVTPWDGFDEGEPFATEPVVIENSAPNPPLVDYTPVPVYDYDNINVMVVEPADDPDGDELVYHYSWSIGGEVVGEDSPILDASFTAPGDLVHVDVWANDGFVDSPITGLDIPVVWPILSDGSVAPVAGAPTETFRYEVTYTSERNIAPAGIMAIIDGENQAMAPVDPEDGDYTDGIVYFLETVLPFGIHTFAFTGWDTEGNQAFGEDVVRPGPVQENTVPVVTEIAIEPFPTATEADLIEVIAVGEDADGDPVELFYQWFNEAGAIEGAVENILTADFFAKGDVVWCQVTPFDGWEFGAPVLSDQVTIVNTPPAIGFAWITSDPEGWFSKLAVLVANVEAADIDGDPLAFDYAWFVDGVEIEAEGPILAPEFFARGNEVHFEVTVTDDDGEFATMASDPVTILNAWPNLDLVDLRPDWPTTVDDLDVDVLVGDADGDEVALTYEWFLNGLPFEWAGARLPRHITEKGQVWRVGVTAEDGMGGMAEAFDEVVIGNFPPEIHGIVETVVVWGVPYFNRINAADADPIDRLVWEIVEGPEGLMIDPFTGEIWWTEFDPEETLGVFPVRVEVTDGEAVSAVGFTMHLYPIGHELFAPRELDALSGYMLSIPMSWQAPNLFWSSAILPLTFTNYEIQRSEDMISWRSVGSPAGTGFVDGSVTSGLTYFYRARAIYEEGVSSWSNTDFAAAGTINSDMIYSNYTYVAPPVLDGELTAGEWSDATQYSVGMQKFYVKNTENALYIAFIDGADSDLNADDAFYVQIEDNFNLRWPTAEGSNEGEYRLTALAGGASEATYQGIWGTYPSAIGRDVRTTSPAVNGAVGGGEEGAVVYELSIEIGDDLAAKINSAMGNVVGFRFASYDAGTFSWTHVWTGGSTNTNPETFGKLMLGIGAGGPAFTVWPRRFEMTVLQGQIGTSPIWISNQGNGIVDYNIYETYLPAWEGGRSRDLTHPVLLFTDEQTIGMDALEFLGYGYYVVNTTADFVSRLSIEEFKATVITVNDGISPAALGALQNFISLGGKAVLVCPNLDAVSGHAIWGDLGVSVFADLGSTPSALTWDLPEHPIFRTPFNVPPSVETVAGSFADYGDGLMAISAVSAASFDEIPYPGNSAITLAGESAIFINSFVMSDELDSDADGWTDGMELLTNQIYYVVGLEDIPWLSVSPEAGRLSSHQTDAGLVTFDATALSEGDYIGYLVATSSDVENPMIPVQCILHVREPEYNLAMFSFPPELQMVRPNQIINLPIQARGLHLASVSEVTMTVRTNEFVISPLDVAGDLYDVTVLSYNLDQITFKVSTDWMMDDGVLCNVRFQVKPTAPAGATSSLQITSVSVNPDAFIEGITTADGRVMVQAGENDWRVMLRFTHGTFEDDLYIGVNPFGTNMFDEGLDMLSDDEGAWFDPYSDIFAFDPANSRLDGDIRNCIEDLIIWTIPVGDSAGKLEWDFRDVDTLGVMGSLFLNGMIDMKTSSVYFYEAGETIYISYRAAGDTPFDVHLYPGWNMVSMPLVLPIVEPTVRNIYPGVAYAYYYDPIAMMWVEATTIEPGVGYVVLATTEQHYTLWGRPVDGFSVPIIPGWNLIGSIYGNTDFSSPTTTPPGAVMAFPQHAAHWDVMLAGYQFSDLLESGKGYFIASNAEAMLSVPGVTLGKAVVPEIGYSAALRIETEGAVTTLKLGTASAEWFVPIPPAVDGSRPEACFKNGFWNISEMFFNEAGECELYVNGPATIKVVGMPVNSGIGIETGEGLTPLEGEIKLPAAGSYKIKFGSLPVAYALHGNVPNPFNPTTSIAFDLPKSSDVRLEVFDMLGRHVRTLEDSRFSAGSYNVVWDGRDSNGRETSSGVYLYRIDAGDFKASRRMLLIK